MVNMMRTSGHCGRTGAHSRCFLDCSSCNIRCICLLQLMCPGSQLPVFWYSFPGEVTVPLDLVSYEEEDYVLVQRLFGR